MRLVTVALGIAAITASNGFAFAAASPPRYVGQELAKTAKISLANARVIAMKARPGVIIDQELEKEAGGSGLRYAFDVKSPGKTYEVGVDANTGKILENGTESLMKEAKEAVQETMEAKPK